VFPPSRHCPDHDQLLADPLAGWRARIAASLPPAAERVRPVRAPGGRPVLVHLAAVRPFYVRLPGKGRPWRRASGQWLCNRGKTQPATVSPAAGPVSCRKCLAAAIRLDIAYPGSELAPSPSLSLSLSS
jgi:hypothetical protein